MEVLPLIQKQLTKGINVGQPKNLDEALTQLDSNPETASLSEEDKKALACKILAERFVANQASETTSQPEVTQIMESTMNQENSAAKAALTKENAAAKAALTQEEIQQMRHETNVSMKRASDVLAVGVTLAIGAAVVYGGKLAYDAMRGNKGTDLIKPQM
jgi:DNA-binding transcriptional regulator YiaG